MTTIDMTPPLSPEVVGRLETEAGLEMADGQIVEKPVSIETSQIEAKIQRLLGYHADQTNSAAVFSATMGYRCYPEDPTKFRKPDVSVVRVERLAGIDRTEGYMPIPADLTVEVISPNDLFYEVAEKVQEYLQNGFGLVWVVSPPTKTVEIHRADGSVALLRESDEISGEAALPTFRCKVSEFFTYPR